MNVTIVTRGVLTLGEPALFKLSRGRENRTSCVWLHANINSESAFIYTPERVAISYETRTLTKEHVDAGCHCCVMLPSSSWQAALPGRETCKGLGPRRAAPAVALSAAEVATWTKTWAAVKPTSVGHPLYFVGTDRVWRALGSGEKNK